MKSTVTTTVFLLLSILLLLQCQEDPCIVPSASASFNVEGYFPAEVKFLTVVNRKASNKKERFGLTSIEGEKFKRRAVVTLSTKTLLPDSTDQTRATFESDPKRKRFHYQASFYIDTIDYSKPGKSKLPISTNPIYNYNNKGVENYRGKCNCTPDEVQLGKVSL